MAIDLKQCDVACLGCVKGYKKKHGNNQRFAIGCSGIPLEYVPKRILATLPPEDARSAVMMLDPVTWAGEVLDWHCIDEDGEIWKRKSRDGGLPQGTLNYYDNTDIGEQKIANGKSPFHRPYQSEMLRCTSKRKVFRVGRQAGKTEALIIAMLHAIFTNHNFHVLLLAPYQAQISMIFKRIREHLDYNPILSNSRSRLVQAPNFEVELYNGSRIRGFTAGTSSKNNAAQARGQSAHMLVFDEADYLAPGDVSAVLATLTNNPRATLWMSSTPTGRREKFYEACHNPLYKEFYYPSMINPNWDLEMETYFRAEYTEIEYKHEILAKFGELEQGVFQASYVDAAKVEYVYESCIRQTAWQYCVGVDWNDTKVGTTIVVTGWDPHMQRFQIVERLTVGREGWTQIKAVQKIITLNRKWIPEYIYIDRGFGATQWELLTKYGYDSLAHPGKGPGHIDSRLCKIVKQYDFGSTIEIRDLHTKQKIKKAAKPFLVENTVRKFEALKPDGSTSIVFAKTDEELETELLGYIIDRVTTTGMPIYKQGNERAGDHVLDALMLSLVAFQLEFTDFGRIRHDPKIAFSGQFGEVTIPPLYEGEQVVTQDPKYRRKQEKAVRQQDYVSRTSNFEQERSVFGSEKDRLPAANTTRATRDAPAIWSWDGFLKDAPHPGTRKRKRKKKKPERTKF